MLQSLLMSFRLKTPLMSVTGKNGLAKFETYDLESNVTIIRWNLILEDTNKLLQYAWEDDWQVYGYKIPLHIHESLGTEVGMKLKDFKFQLQLDMLQDVRNELIISNELDKNVN